MDDETKLPRLFVTAPLVCGTTLTLDERPAHYLKNVLRRQTGDFVRLFNGVDGEVLARLSVEKRSVVTTIDRILRPQVSRPSRLALMIPPLKKARMDMLVEKAVELGVSDIFPILTDHADVRDVNADRMAAQITEAAEQCERLDLPLLHPLIPLRQALRDAGSDFTLVVAVEREDIPLLSQASYPPTRGVCVLIGPAGGWSDAERQMLLDADAQGLCRCVSLGDDILRAETAALAMLAYFKFTKEGA